MSTTLGVARTHTPEMFLTLTMSTGLSSGRLRLFAAVLVALLLAACGESPVDSGAHEHDAQQTHAAPDDHAVHAEHEDQVSHTGHSGEEEHEAHAHDAGLVHLSEAELAEFGIELRTAEGGEISVTRQLPGEIVFNPDLVAQVTPRVPGVVQEILRRTGDRVEQGDVLAVLASRALAQAKSDYLSAQARVELVEATFERKQRLAEQQIASEAEVLESRQALREARLAQQLAERELQALGQGREQIAGLADQEEAGLARYELTAPLDGTIIARRLTLGETISADVDQAPFVIADTDTVWAQLTVYPRDLGVVHPGQRVRVIAEGGGMTAEGSIDYVTPQMREATRAATARVVLDNLEGRWRPGQFVTAQVQIDRAHAEVVVPESALQTVEQEPAVFVLTGEGFEVRRVETGRRAQDRVEIEAGLHPGERYAATNTFTLKAEHGREALEGAGHVH